MLPIMKVASRITQHLSEGNRLVLTAPTGSGKTTQVPQILLRSGFVRGQIIVLQPRRLTTRLMACRVATELGEPVGELCGYQTRHERRLSDRTRIRFMTEGVFLRLMQTDPRLNGVGAVILDEFHERSLAADMALGLVKRLHEASALEPAPYLVVMSATLDARSVGQHLDCPTIEATGRSHPVEIRYLPRRIQAPCWEQAADAVMQILDGDPPAPQARDVLVFMPGVYEIRRTIEACQRRLTAGREPISLFPLHGTLPAEEQDAAVGPCPHRKVIVSTNVAETSITIEGLGYVIDSGLARVHHQNARRSLNVLLIEPISQASADQRAGRAGRTAPGICFRLWTKAEHPSRPPLDVPEISRLDLAQYTLQLKAMGVEDVSSFPWLDAPRPQSVQRAEQLLHDLGAIDTTGRLTHPGRIMAQFPLHPRLSRMLFEAHQRACLTRAVLWAALISERDIRRGQLQARFTEPSANEPPSDLVVLERAFNAARVARFAERACAGMGVSAAACREVEQASRLYGEVCRRRGWSMDHPGQTENLLKCLLVGFYDHVALRRETGNPTCAMPGRKRVVLDAQSVVREPGLLLALEIRELEAGRSVRTVLSLASNIRAEWLEEMQPQRLSHATTAAWNEQQQAVEQVETYSFDGLVYRQTNRPKVDPQLAAEFLVERIANGQLKLEKWDQAVEQWIKRTRCVSQWFPEQRLITYSPEDCKLIYYTLVSGSTRYSQIKDRPCLSAVKGALSWEDQQFVERMAPSQIRLPNGRALKVEYQPGSPPRGRAKIQDLYDLHDTPRIAGGRQPLLLEILGPNFRPLQVTDDLRGFWERLYPQLKQQLRRRYPRHEWR